MDRQVQLTDTIHISDGPDWKLSFILRYVYIAADKMDIEQVIQYAMYLS